MDWNACGMDFDVCWEIFDLALTPQSHYRIIKILMEKLK